ncbi:9190_t:CDS:1, partial [Scutellospora calospora]
HKFQEFEIQINKYIKGFDIQINKYIKGFGINIKGSEIQISNILKDLSYEGIGMLCDLKDH